jgi:hypothetical protein
MIEASEALVARKPFGRVLTTVVGLRGAGVPGSLGLIDATSNAGFVACEAKVATPDMASTKPSDSFRKLVNGSFLPDVGEKNHPRSAEYGTS